MYGVVLWSDHGQDRAVIWCEDHGDLAYYDGERALSDANAAFEPGDLVRFDVSEGRRMRIASNPQIVASDQYPNLAGDLRREGEGPTEPIPKNPAQGQSKVIPLVPRDPPMQALRKPKASNG
jgi:hypothetical protein